MLRRYKIWRTKTSIQIIIIGEKRTLVLQNIELKNKHQKKNYVFIFQQRGREGQRKGEKHQLVASLESPARDLACNPGMCPDWEPNLRLSVCRMTPNPLSYTGQDKKINVILLGWPNYYFFILLTMLLVKL